MPGLVGAMANQCCCIDATITGGMGQHQHKKMVWKSLLVNQSVTISINFVKLKYPYPSTDSVGKSFAEAYFPIVNKRREIPFGDREKKFQAYRRGRYVEFNLVYDRGTIFGLQSGGRIESILMSMPPNANWVYDFKPEFGTDEQRLYEFLKPTNWLDI